jgi:hypothetical protein
MNNQETQTTETQIAMKEVKLNHMQTKNCLNGSIYSDVNKKGDKSCYLSPNKYNPYNQTNAYHDLLDSCMYKAMGMRDFSKEKFMLKRRIYSASCNLSPLEN